MQEKEYSDLEMPRHQERKDRDHLQPEELVLLLRQVEELTGSMTEEEHQAHPLHHFENMNDKEVWWNADKEENLIVNFVQLIYLKEKDFVPTCRH